MSGFEVLLAVQAYNNTAGQQPDSEGNGPLHEGIPVAKWRILPPSETAE